MDKGDGESFCRTRHLEGSIVETVYQGKIETVMIEQVQRDLLPLLRSLGGGADWLVDTSGITQLKPAPSAATSGFFKAFRAAGGRRVAAVVTSGGVRMIASALAFAMAQDLKVFATREEALRYLRA